MNNSSKRNSVRPCSVVYAILVVLTFGTFTVGELGLGGLPVVAFVLLMTLIKGQLVVSWFMGLRWSPLRWRLVMTGYLTIVGAAIGVAYVMGID